MTGQPQPFRPFPPQAEAEAPGLLHPSETADQEALEGVEVLMALITVLGPAAMFPLFLRRKEKTEEMAITAAEAGLLEAVEGVLERQVAAQHSGRRVMAEMG
jgi:hypothetical protein